MVKNDDRIVDDNNKNGSLKWLRGVYTALGIIAFLGTAIWCMAVGFSNIDRNAKDIGKNCQDIETIKSENKVMFGKWSAIDERTKMILDIVKKR